MSQYNHGLCRPVISAIIEREVDNEIEVLIQTRWKPDKDPVYSGTIEIPAGHLDEYENVYETVKREVFEETGLKIKEFFPNIHTKIYSPKDDGAFAFLPFCCQQQVKGGKPWVGFVFICKVEDGEPVAQQEETKDIRWVKRDELKKIFDETPEQIFTLQLGVIDYYLNNRN